jgi:hypothetical protein
MLGARDPLLGTFYVDYRRDTFQRVQDWQRPAYRHDAAQARQTLRACLTLPWAALYLRSLGRDRLILGGAFMSMKKYSAEAIGTFWLTFGGCGSAVIAALAERGHRLPRRFARLSV